MPCLALTYTVSCWRVCIKTVHSSNLLGLVVYRTKDKSHSEHKRQTAVKLISTEAATATPQAKQMLAVIGTWAFVAKGLGTGSAANDKCLRAPWQLQILAVLCNLGVLNSCVHIVQVLHDVCVVTTHCKVHWAVAILHDMGSQSRETLSLADSMWARHLSVGPASARFTCPA